MSLIFFKEKKNIYILYHNHKQYIRITTYDILCMILLESKAARNGVYYIQYDYE